MSAVMPAEWEHHAGTWVAWPHQKADWPGKFEPVPWVWCEIIRHLARGERVRVVVPEAKADQVKQTLLRAGADLSVIDLIPAPTDRVWLRDSGAATVWQGDGSRSLVNWRFNGWAKYPNCKRDARMGEVYHAVYEKRGDDFTEVQAPGLYKPAEVPALPAGQWSGCGSGFAVYRGELDARYAGSLERIIGNLAPHAREIAALAAKQFARGDVVDAADAVPLYVRNKVAMKVNER